MPRARAPISCSIPSFSGYPPEDLVLKPAFLKACEKAAQEFAADTSDGGPGVIIGTPLKRKSGTHNSIIVADGGVTINGGQELKIPQPASLRSAGHSLKEEGFPRLFRASGDHPIPLNLAVKGFTAAWPRVR